jgi:hypothetical protein
LARRAWRVVAPLALAAVEPEEIDKKATLQLQLQQLRLGPLFGLLGGDEDKAVALHVLLPATILNPVIGQIVMLFDSSGCAPGGYQL